MHVITAKAILGELLEAYNAWEHGDYFYDHGDVVCEAVACVLEQPRWISVEERLPEPYQTVLVRRRHINASDCYTTTDHIVPVYGDNKMWAGTARTWKLGVTHWMPLPEAPEVEV